MNFFRNCVASLSLLTAAATLAVTPAQAKPIQYVFSGTISGSLKGVSFTGSGITFTALGDTSNIVRVTPFPGFSDFQNPTGNPMFTLDGFGSGSLTDLYAVFAIQDAPSAVGLSQRSSSGSSGDIFDVVTPSLASYDLSTSFGPVSGRAVSNLNSTFGTTLGDLKITEFDQGTFTADTAPPVPEASTTTSLGLLLALGGLVVAAKRKKASA